MSQPDDERLVALEAGFERDDPRFARAMRAGRPSRPREYRRTGAWWALAVAVAVLITGVFLPDGLLIATGLVLAGIAAQLFDPHRARARRRPPRR
ncbi:MULTISPECIES: DUF3040 domain-containing protein [Streptomyces]|uniref:DUF3040 domain-containing protein n=1 Tax=Streptomyces cadmiisoli TaxID=2184053 RepID=A0A2Z4J3X3_9ACTN|nr:MULTISPECIES: DUF3040 domain-containing protein [Streptomyces]AWW39073.1 DUF3040 domain-containing protein [Streptomyces cadmiisoli]KOV56011.1 hypothetical protein ADL00_27940 [Streptomyces sp. AS58]